MKFPCANLSFSIPQQLLVGQNLLFIEASRSHSDTQHSVGLLLKSDQSHYNTQHSPETDIRATDVIRTSNPGQTSGHRPTL